MFPSFIDTDTQITDIRYDKIQLNRELMLHMAAVQSIFLGEVGDVNHAANLIINDR